jgi:DNA helicase II / ATP-dependent DNA helicase PcrA
MTTENAQTLETALAKLTPIQRKAVDWGEGALLALAGPGSGKTQVLTCRIARLLNASREKKFRILALTFTNKAADEMLIRVQDFVPGLEERASIGTFHSFCTQVLRQHGVHLDIQPDFTIYALDNDRLAVLEDALRRAMTSGKPVSLDDVRYLSIIDKLKARLIDPEKAPGVLAKLQDSERIALVYECYEAELRRVNALDFNSLILQTHRLATTFPAIVMRYRRSHPYWLIDEFQDTNDAQYRLIRAMAGDGFRNVFAVADDDQIIYQWNGASFRQLQRFRVDFEPELVQLPTNYRCPPAIVEAANRLVAYNVQRIDAKQPLVAGKTELKLPAEEHIRLGHYDTEEVEAQKIAADIAWRPAGQWGEVAVLARTRALLERVCMALHDVGVPAAIAQRRDDFLSAEFRWLVACLRQALRPLDRRNLVILVEAFNRLGGIEISADQIMANAEASGRSYLTEWLTAATSTRPSSQARSLLEAVAPLTQDTSGYAHFIESAIAGFDDNDEEASVANDLAEDTVAWREINVEISRHLGRHPGLDQFLQELGLRSKEPSPKPGTVTLMTIHGAKGREFDFVYVIGLAEDVMPSYQSRQRGDSSAEMEEERRNCFVAITRAKEGLTLSWADRYRGYGKRPSRFLVEMGFLKVAA